MTHKLSPGLDEAIGRASAAYARLSRRIHAAPAVLLELENCLAILLHEFPPGCGRPYDRDIATARAAIAKSKGAA